MLLIIISIVLGFIGANIGGLIGSDFYVFCFTAIGMLSPALFVLQSIYKKLVK